MSVNNEDIQALVDDSVDHAAVLLALLTSMTRDPTTAMATLLLASAAFAKSMGLPQQDLLQGTAAAFDSLEEGSHHAPH